MPDFGRAYFDALYAKHPDPWDVRHSAYEHDKYAHTLAALPRERYAHLLELGCSIGELTRRLAERADRVTAVDVSPLALAEARRVCAARENVRFVEARLPDGEWDGPFDAVVLSEILYYLDRTALAALAQRIAARAPTADLVLVHWTGDTDYPLSGDEAVEGFTAHLPDHVTNVGVRTSQYRLDRLVHRRP